MCRLDFCLTQEGAERTPWSNLNEQRCYLSVRASNDHVCIYGLRLDVPAARYRQVSKGVITRMCDFALLAVLGRTAKVVVIELKSGAASPDDIKQLSEGLRVLHDLFQQNGLKVRPRAYFVVGKEAAKLGFSLRDKLTSLRFGDRLVPLKILDCGEVLNL